MLGGASCGPSSTLSLLLCLRCRQPGAVGHRTGLGAGTPPQCPAAQKCTHARACLQPVPSPWAMVVLPGAGEAFSEGLRGTQEGHRASWREAFPRCAWSWEREPWQQAHSSWASEPCGGGSWGSSAAGCGPARSLARLSLPAPPQVCTHGALQRPVWEPTQPLKARGHCLSPLAPVPLPSVGTLGLSRRLCPA